MKAKIFFPICLFFFVLFSAQNKNYIIGFGDTFITASNNYFDPKVNSSKDVIIADEALKNQQADIFGSRLEISASFRLLNVDSYSFLIADKRKLPEYKFDVLEFTIIQNGKILSDWKKIVHTKQNFEISKSYSLFAGDLNDGDELKLYFRSVNRNVFFSQIFRKKTVDVIPFYMGDFHSYKRMSLESFLKESMNAKKTFNPSFYKDWPSSYHTKSNTITEKVDENTRFALFFRPRNSGSVKNMIEYRVLESGSPIQNIWNTADDFIILGDFKPGKNYILQARYKGQTKVFEKEFISQPVWYQNFWVKIGTGLFLVLLIALVYNFFKNIEKKKLQQEQSNKLQLLASQLNPHFIFNSLNSIQGLVNNNDNLNANLYISEFAKLMRNIVDFGQQTTIPLFEDINALKHYLSLEKLRFLFNYELEINENLGLKSIEVLPFLVQPLIENSVKHGVSKLKENGLIIVKIYKDQSDLIYEISDNGSGFDVNNVKKRTGLKLVKDRINLYNFSSKSKPIDLKIISSHSGTTVFVTYKNLL